MKTIKDAFTRAAGLRVQAWGCSGRIGWRWVMYHNI